MRAVVLISGGMDSLVTAGLAAEAGRECAFLHVTYGQRTAGRERRAFDEISDYYKPRKRVVADIGYLSAIGGSALTDSSIPIPDTPERPVPSTYVPFRNAHLVAIATSLAEAEGAAEIFIGACEVDYSGYPDCSREFFDAMEAAIEAGTKPDTHITIVTPLVDKTKAEIVAEGLRLGAPFELSWSCYRSSKVACGTCESCRLRLKGFAQAGAQDPIGYM